VTDKNTVERVNVAILARDADRVHVDADLKAGDKVVLEGGSVLRNGQTVQPQGS
jgi:multidrug efflux pump subunit AcrA (membrane-fusion protein)